MKYFVEVDGEEHEVELVERLGRLIVRLDGEPLDARYEEVDRLGQVAFFVGRRSYAISIEVDDENTFVTVAGHGYRVRVEDERERAAGAVEDLQAARGGEIKSVMPGVVKKLLVAEGDDVEPQQALVILEAMKMQNEISAPARGRVRALHVCEGQAVGSGARLVTLAFEE